MIKATNPYLKKNELKNEHSGVAISFESSLGMRLLRPIGTVALPVTSGLRTLSTSMELRFIVPRWLS